MAYRVSVEVPPEIRDIAGRYGVSINTVIRWAIAVYLEHSGPIVINKPERKSDANSNRNRRR